jgi:hypothetical protein
MLMLVIQPQINVESKRRAFETVCDVSSGLAACVTAVQPDGRTALGALAGIDVTSTHESFGTNQGSGRRPMPFNGRLAEAA